MLTNNKSRAFAIDASIGQCPTLVAATLYPLAHTAIHNVVLFGLPDSHCSLVEPI